MEQNAFAQMRNFFVQIEKKRADSPRSPPVVPPIPEDEEEELSDFVCARSSRYQARKKETWKMKKMHESEKLDSIFACLPHLSFFQAHILALLAKSSRERIYNSAAVFQERNLWPLLRKKGDEEAY